ncbi:glycoside hydrolase family 43 protein [Dactylosporangium sp. AC04546]|uniref:glycoside hydrolase family 43 protein n=1 Tax=Dactylosporangium sp. AC04546 TaxID=2862460 RepID=UPI001EDEE79E|nr:glycoside hydrolase family 43 protein [Dactylosporangium sp. AC04546]WVK81499.1 glycoside hydrolase family 43 protein [Dactylosporangium sp. AC04546]
MTPGTIRNPVLPGFHPDPSILRVGDDYYLATSTFEWYPGVRIHHSRDLVHWRPVGGALADTRLLDLTGVPDSGGVWAPCLSYVGGLFHLVYTDVKSYGGFWDTPNSVVTASSVEGPWSDPVPLHAQGFDPSLFHDVDGRSWLVSNRTDWRPGRPWANGIIIQEYDRNARQLVGEPVTVYTGTPAGMTEGPHLYRRDGWYYLVTAEGGTDWFHQVTVARSRDILGPYETDPGTPLVTSVHRPDLALQKAGHGSLVETPAGEWYLAHLAGRPLTPRGRCVLGRETALQRVTWTDDGWPRVEGGVPHDVVSGPDLPAHPWPSAPETDDFTAASLGPDWSTLRRPFSASWASTGGGRLRVHGGRSPGAQSGESMVARRVQHHRATFEATVLFEPRHFQQMAGLTAYYNSRNWYFLRVGFDERQGVVVDVLSSDRGRVTMHRPAVPVDGPVRLRFDLEEDVLRASCGSTEWGPFDATILSDEYAREHDSAWGFTGAFFGLWVQDLTGGGLPADFTAATYKPQL